MVVPGHSYIAYLHIHIFEPFSLENEDLLHMLLIFYLPPVFLRSSLHPPCLAPVSQHAIPRHLHPLRHTRLDILSLPHRAQDPPPRPRPRPSTVGNQGSQTQRPLLLAVLTVSLPVNRAALKAPCEQNRDPAPQPYGLNTALHLPLLHDLRLRLCAADALRWRRC